MQQERALLGHLGIVQYVRDLLPGSQARAMADEARERDPGNLRDQRNVQQTWNAPGAGKYQSPWRDATHPPLEFIRPLEPGDYLPGPDGYQAWRAEHFTKHVAGHWQDSAGNVYTDERLHQIHEAPIDFRMQDPHPLDTRGLAEQKAQLQMEEQNDIQTERYFARLQGLPEPKSVFPGEPDPWNASESPQRTQREFIEAWATTPESERPSLFEWARDSYAMAHRDGASIEGPGPVLTLEEHVRNTMGPAAVREYASYSEGPNFDPFADIADPMEEAYWKQRDEARDIQRAARKLDRGTALEASMEFKSEQMTEIHRAMEGAINRGDYAEFVELRKTLTVLPVMVHDSKEFERFDRSIDAMLTEKQPGWRGYPDAGFANKEDRAINRNLQAAMENGDTERMAMWADARDDLKGQRLEDLATARGIVEKAQAEDPSRDLSPVLSHIAARRAGLQEPTAALKADQHVAQRKALAVDAKFAKRQGHRRHR